MTLRPLILLLSFTFAARVAAAKPTGRVESKLSLPEKVWVGQRVSMTIRVLAPGFSMEGVPAFDLPEIPGLLALKLSGSPRIGNETIDDETYVTQIHEFALFPQRAGDIAIPSFPVRFASSAGYGQPVTSFTVPTQELHFTARFPPGAENLPVLISSSHVSMKETWSTGKREMRIGEALTRTVTMNGLDIPGMEFPPLKFAPIDGVGIYPGQPSVSDVGRQDSLSGERIEQVTYVFERPGTYSLPGYSLIWWDLKENMLKQEQIAGQTLSVAGTGQDENPSAVADPIRQYGYWLVAGGGMALFSIFGMFFLLSRRTSAFCHEETARFQELSEACRSDDCSRILAKLTVWLSTLPASPEPLLVEQWARKTGDRQLVELVGQLEAELYQPASRAAPASFSGKKLLKSLRLFRHRAFRPHRQKKEEALKPLNPL